MKDRGALRMHRMHMDVAQAGTEPRQGAMIGVAAGSRSRMETPRKMEALFGDAALAQLLDRLERLTETLA